MNCISCGAETVDQATIYFINAAHQDVAMCEKCNPYLERVLSESDYILEFVKFAAPDNISNVRQCGKFHAFQVSGSEEIQDRLKDIGVFCEFIANRVYARRFSEPKEGK